MNQQTASPSMACLSLSIGYCSSHWAPNSHQDFLSSSADRFLYSCPLLFTLPTSFSFIKIFSQLLLLFTDHHMGFFAQIPYHNSCPVVVWSLHGCCPPLSPSEPTRAEEHLDVLFTHKKEMVRDVIIIGSLGWSSCEIMKFKIES